MDKKNGRGRWRRGLSKVPDALLLVIGCFAWIITALLMVLLFWP